MFGRNNRIIILIFTLIVSSLLAACSVEARRVDPDAIFSNKFADELTVHFFHMDLPKKTGESIFIQTPKGKSVLIDAGIPEVGEIVDGYLDEMNIDKIDLVMPSHPHVDHIGGLHTVLSTKEIGKVLETNVPHDTATYKKYKEIINDKNIPFEYVEAGDVIELEEDIFMEILNPPIGTSMESLVEDYSMLGAAHINNISTVIKLTHGENTFLFTGDIYQERERQLVEEYGDMLKSDVLVAPHHGDVTSSSKEFIQTVDPIISVIPSNILFNQIVNDRYEVDQESELFHSVYHGNILLRSNGEDIKVITEKERESEE